MKPINSKSYFVLLGMKCIKLDQLSSNGKKIAYRILILIYKYPIGLGKIKGHIHKSISVYRHTCIYTCVSIYM